MGNFARGNGTYNPVLPAFNEVSSLLLTKRYLTVAAWRIPTHTPLFPSCSISIFPVVQGGERGGMEDKIVSKQRTENMLAGQKHTHGF